MKAAGDQKPKYECGFSYMGQRGARRGQSLRASWQWQRQCQTLEEEKTCTMVNPKPWKYGTTATRLGLDDRVPSGISHDEQGDPTNANRVNNPRSEHAKLTVTAHI